MGVTTSLFVCCLTCLSVAVKVANHRSHAATALQDTTNPPPPRWTRERFTPELEAELGATGSGRTVCPICCEEFGEDRDLELVVLECVLAYHFACLESYALYRPNSKDTPLLCPVCQSLAVSATFPITATL